MERYPRSYVERRPRTGRAPAAGITALALAGLCAVGSQPTQAKPAAQAAPAAEPPPAAELPAIEGGRVTGQTTPDNARRDGLTVVDLSDDWLPYVFSEEPGKPEPLRPFLIDLANGRFSAHQLGLRACARGPSVLRGVRGFPEPEHDAAAAGGSQAPHLP